MDEMDADYSNYWETRMFFENDELESWSLDEVFADVYDVSRPPNGAGSSDKVGSLSGPDSSSSLDDKNIITERNRRKRFNDRLYALRSLVPNITKMDKVSIIEDAISYIKDLEEQERRMFAEITELELRRDDKSPVTEIHQDDQLVLGSRKEMIKRTTARSSLLQWKLSIENVKVCEVGERTLIVSITCNKRDPMIKLCKLFESLNLKIMSANVVSLSGSLLHTLYVETNGMKSDQLKEKIF